MNKKIVSIIKSKGMKGLLQRGLLKILGISNQQEEIDSLFYFFNKYINIESIPPTDNVGLRNLQKCDTMLLNIFDKICAKYNLSYWLDYGTLLGAIRHKGFIPWDDDTDVAMLRSDYNKLIDLASSDFKMFGIDFKEDAGRIGIGYLHSQTGIWLDVFPVDIIRTNKEIREIKSHLIKLYGKYLKLNGKKSLKSDRMSIAQLKNDLYKEYMEGDNIYYISCPEFPGSWQGISHDLIFPLVKMKFENYEFFVPNQFKLYLEELYGTNYMSFPRNGIERHGVSSGRPPLGTWAEINNINMDRIHFSLEEIYNKC